MTQKRRSKVREAEPAPVVSGEVRVNADQLKAASGGVESEPPGPPIDVPVSQKPLALVEDRTREQLIADGDYAPPEPEPTLLSRPEPDLFVTVDGERVKSEDLSIVYPSDQYRSIPVEHPVESESEVILRRLNESPELRGFVARYMASMHAITEANGGVAPVMVLPEAAPEVQPGLVGVVRVELEWLWVKRLQKMAEVVGQTPNDYLRTLLTRAWCAMPRRDRE